MKKIFSLFVFVFVVFSYFVPAQASILRERIGILIIASSDFKTQDFYECAKENLSDPTNSKYMIVTGSDIEGKYSNYWLDKGFLEEQAPNKDSLLEFAAYSNYDKVLYLLIQDPQMERNNHSVAGWWGASVNIHNRVSLKINAFLCDGNSVIQTASVTKTSDSYYSDLRAKRKAFNECLTDISSKIKPAFLKTKTTS